MSEKRKMPVDLDTVTLEDKWQGWQFVARTNYSMEVLELLMSGRPDRGLSTVVHSWNFVNEAGHPLPNPNDVKEKSEQEALEKLQKELPEGAALPPDVSGIKEEAGREAVEKLLKRLPVNLLIAMGRALTNKTFEISKN